MKRLHYILLSLLSGLLLSLSWPGIGYMPFLLFIALVPLLLVEWDIAEKKATGHPTRGFFRYAYLAMFSWNLGTTWWIWCVATGLETKIISAGTAILLNSFFQAVVLWCFHITRRWLGPKRGYISLVLYWMAFEYLHFNWDLSYPWLTLGNAWASAPSYIQWYEYTGVAGGSLWVLLVNLTVLSSVRGFTIHNKWKRFPVFSTLALILIPAFFSLWLYVRYEEKGDPADVVVVQPNIDPYTDKFGDMSPEEQVHRMLALAQPLLNDSVDYLVGPETSLPKALNTEKLETAPLIQYIEAFLAQYPNVKMITGLSSFRVYLQEERPTETARLFEDGSGWSDYYNSAMQIGNGQRIQLYHKSKLVLGVEKMPFPSLFNPIQEIIWDLGGTSGSLGTQKERTVFISENPAHTVAPVICWESVYGDFMAQYIRGGARLVFVVTNDGWWGNTPGYHQHMAYARLRAIEFRRSIARSANTGISCFIDQRGQTRQETPWWTPTAIRGKIHANDTLTVYARTGDALYRVAAWLAIFMLAYGGAMHLKNRAAKRKKQA